MRLFTEAPRAIASTRAPGKPLLTNSRRAARRMRWRVRTGSRLEVTIRILTPADSIRMVTCLSRPRPLAAGPVADLELGAADLVGRAAHHRDPRQLAGSSVHLDDVPGIDGAQVRSEEHTSELQSHVNLVCRL